MSTCENLGNASGDDFGLAIEQGLWSDRERVGVGGGENRGLAVLQRLDYRVSCLGGVGGKVQMD